MTTPEELACIKIDELLAACGWTVQDRGQLNLSAGRGVAVREFPMGDEGFADYLLFVDRKPVGVIEAKAQGTTLLGVTEQSGRYLVDMANLPDPDVLAKEVTEDLRSALAQFESLEEELGGEE